MAKEVIDDWHSTVAFLQDEENNYGNFCKIQFYWICERQSKLSPVLYEMDLMNDSEMCDFLLSIFGYV